MTSYTISSGQTSAYTLASGDSLTVLSGGISDGSMIGNDAVERVMGGGVARGDSIADGGLLVLSSGSQASSLNVDGIVSGPGALAGATINSGVIQGVRLTGVVSNYGTLSGLTVVGTVYNYGGTDIDDQITGYEDVISGVISGARVLSGGEVVVAGTAEDVTVYSGGLADLDFTLSAHQSASVPSLGSAPATVAGVTFESGSLANIEVQVRAGAVLDVASGGMVDALSVSKGGDVGGPGLLGRVTDAGLISGCALSGPDLIAPGELLVSSGGVAEDISATEGVIVISSGGLVSGLSTTGEGRITVLGGGSAADLSLDRYVDITVVGRTLSTLLQGAEFVVQSGVADDASILSGGVEYVESRGAVSGTVVSSGGVEMLQIGGVERDVTVLSGGALDVQVISSGLTLAISDQPLSATMSLYGAALESGSYLNLEAFGGLRVDADATLYVPAGMSFIGGLDILVGGLVSGGGMAGEYVSVSGEIEGLTIVNVSGLEETSVVISPGGLAKDITVSGGEFVVGGSASAVNAVIDGPVQFFVESGGVASVTTLTKGGAYVASGGAFIGGTIAAGVALDGPGLIEGVVDDQGTISGANLLSATLFVEAHGVVSSTLVSSGAREVISVGARAYGTRLQGGVQIVSGGIVADTVVGSGGRETLAGGSIAGITVSAGGYVTIQEGLIDGGEISSGGRVAGSGQVEGVLSVAAGGALSGVSFLSRSFDILVHGAIESGVAISSGGTLQLVDAAVVRGATLDVGVVSAVTTLSGTSLLVGADIETLSAAVGAHGLEIVGSRGVALATTVSAGGELELLAHGVLSGGVIDAGGLVSGPGSIRGATLNDAGMASGANVDFDGILTVASGGGAANDVVYSGGLLSGETGAELVDIALRAGAALVDDGALTYTSGSTLAGVLAGDGQLTMSGRGTLTISGDGSGFDGGLVIEGGIVDLAASFAIGSGEVEFADGSAFETLEIGASAIPVSGGTLVNRIIDLAGATDRLDLQSVAFVSGARAVLSGSTLTLADGGYEASFILGGTAATRYVVSSDGAGGTLIHAAVGASTMPLVQAAAGFAAAPQIANSYTGQVFLSSATNTSLTEQGAPHH